MTTFRITLQHEFSSQRITRTIKAANEAAVMRWLRANLPSHYYATNIRPI